MKEVGAGPVGAGGMGSYIIFASEPVKILPQESVNCRARMSHGVCKYEC